MKKEELLNPRKPGRVRCLTILIQHQLEKEIIAYLDQYESVFLHSHRVVFYHEQGVRQVVKKFGPEAQKIAEQHIISDLDAYFTEVTGLRVTEVPKHWSWRPFQKWFWPTAELVRGKQDRTHPSLCEILEDVYGTSSSKDLKTKEG